jgi:hypothetical protein
MKKIFYALFLFAVTSSMVACEYNAPEKSNGGNSDDSVSKPTLYIGKWVNQTADGTKILNFSSEMGTAGSITFLDAAKTSKTVERFNSYIEETVGDTTSDVRFENKSSSCPTRANAIYRRSLNVQGNVLIMTEYSVNNTVIHQFAFTRPSAEQEGSLSTLASNAFELCLNLNY